MGYDVHVTRAGDWTQSQATPIPLEEWLAYVAQDPEMRHDGYAEGTTAAGETVRYENDGLAVWTSYSQHGAGGNMAWLDHRDGRIVVKNPDQEILRKLYEIASHFGARVQGDEGEEYDSDGRQIDSTPSPAAKRLWSRLFGRASR